MFKPNDPRFRRRLNEISASLETANVTAQTRVFLFGQQYISPCLDSISACFAPCTSLCCGGRDLHHHGRRGQHGRAELNFDFYDDWEADETEGLLGWDDEEYDSFLAGPSVGAAAYQQQQPGRQRAMSYGTRRDVRSRRTEADTDTGGGFFSFLNRIPGLGHKNNLRYKPSAAGLQEHPGGGTTRKAAGGEDEPFITDESDGSMLDQRNRRRRRGTVGSQSTGGDSLSSRGDIFPSEDEDDAIPLDDEFAMVLERRTTGSGSGVLDDGMSSSGVTGTSRRERPRPGYGSRRSTRTTSSRSTRRSVRSDAESGGGGAADAIPRDHGIREEHTLASDDDAAVLDDEAIARAAALVPTLTELKLEEEQVRADEEAAVEQGRKAAQALALAESKGVAGSTVESDAPIENELPDAMAVRDEAGDDFGELEAGPTSAGDAKDENAKSAS